MKASELRVGNFIYINGVANQLSEIHRNSFKFKGNNTLWNEKQCKPITLTEEWLLKFGFPWEIKYQANGNDDFGGLFSECYPKENGYNLLMKKDKFMLVTEIKYVHQLQNLYFALTGEELTINQ